jgi:hypothetical protein
MLSFQARALLLLAASVVSADTAQNCTLEFGDMLSTIAGAGGGSGTVSPSPLAPRQAVDVESCGVRGNGSAKDDHVRLLVYVDKVDFEDCHYKPSLRIPRSLMVHTVW